MHPRFDEGIKMLLSMLLVVPAQEVVARAQELRAATPWVEVFSASCGRRRLEVRRSMRPLERGSRVLINGRTVPGDVSSLEAELSEVRAAYRMSFRCSQNGETMQLNWVSGLAGQDGQVSYRVGSAEFSRGTLVRSGSEEANEETFWYR